MQEDTRRGLELVAGAAVAALLTIAAMIYAGRVIGPEEYADFSAGLAVIYLVTLAMSPIIPTVARIAARSVTRDRIAAALSLRRSLLRATVAAIVVALPLLALTVGPASRWLRLRSSATLAWAIAAALAYVVVSIERGFLQGLFRFREYNANTIIEAAIRAALVFGFAGSITAASFAVGAWAAGTLAALMVVFASLERESRRRAAGNVDWTEFFALLRPMILLMISLAIFQNTDMLAVKRFLAPEQAGAYGAASALSRGFGVLFVPLYALAGPLLTHAHERRKSVAAATWKLSGGYLALVAIPLIVIAVWHGPIVSLLYGSAYGPAGDVLLPLCGVTVITYCALMLSQGLITTGDYGFTLGYVIAALAQIAGLAFAHSSYRQVLAVLYVCQGATLLFVTIIFLKSQKMTRDGSRSSKA